MQSDQKHLRQKTELPLADQVGSGYISNPPIASLFGQNVDFQPSKICPRNFIIFDRTDNHSQIMYHPAVAQGFGYPGLNHIKDRMGVRNDMNDRREIESVMKEDSADIDLLLSFEEDEYEEEEEEEVSTGRTQGNDASDTADSCSSRPLRKSGLGVLSSSCSQKSSERKREKMRKMVNSLRGIVPGGNRMNTVGVLDEAVKYLKSLKVELQKVEN
ncbi:transcription factor bHLH144-like [Cynara cardunculus var. scolymus]|uniref:Myc-type, basic helix-loop-helix (BHLH) domain-containing protein n=1 Tax=Cynara cardunculus var. scolymus TaxID=59895 RepID=A0A103Y1M0_CYNCS|nr:transcription factor bHLH144-like [Cynara cardunculus var. scolymus]KVI00864.1 Myc-type, basic helix-loop-helix (bHLH) domain-containing protein [Cynara cardunculus var. scolymus]